MRFFDFIDLTTMEEGIRNTCKWIKKRIKEKNHYHQNQSNQSTCLVTICNINPREGWLLVLEQNNYCNERNDSSENRKKSFYVSIVKWKARNIFQNVSYKKIIQNNAVVWVIWIASTDLTATTGSQEVLVLRQNTVRELEGLNLDLTAHAQHS